MVGDIVFLSPPPLQHTLQGWGSDEGETGLLLNKVCCCGDVSSPPTNFTKFPSLTHALLFFSLFLFETMLAVKNLFFCGRHQLSAGTNDTVSLKAGKCFIVNCILFALAPVFLKIRTTGK